MTKIVARLFAHLGCISAAPRLDRQHGMRRAWPCRLLFPAIGGALCIWAMFETKANEWGGLGLLALAGAMLFFISQWESRWPKLPQSPTA